MIYTSCGIERKAANGKGWLGFISYKNEDGKWCKKRKNFKTKYKRDALRMLNEWREHEEQLAQRQVTYKTVEQAVKEYAASQYHLGQINTVTYQRNLAQAGYAIFPYIGNESFYEITTETLQKYINKLCKKYKKNTVETYFAIFDKAYRNAITQGKIIKDARAGLIMPKEKKRHEIAYLDKDGRAQLQSLLNGGELIGASNNDLYIPILLAYYGGLRAGEICALRWNDVNYRNNTIRITKAAKQIKDEEGKNIVIVEDTKTYSKRIIPMMPQLSRALEIQEEKDNPNARDFICYWRNPRLLGSAFQKWAGRNELISVLDKPLTMHGLRHTFATIAVESKMDIKSLASILGHKDASMTLNIYASDDENAKQANIMALAAMMEQEESSDF